MVKSFLCVGRNAIIQILSPLPLRCRCLFPLLIKKGCQSFRLRPFLMVSLLLNILWFSIILLLLQWKDLIRFNAKEGRERIWVSRKEGNQVHSLTFWCLQSSSILIVGWTLQAPKDYAEELDSSKRYIHVWFDTFKVINAIKGKKNWVDFKFCSKY